jgi:hypothetical protein
MTEMNITTGNNVIDQNYLELNLGMTTELAVQTLTAITSTIGEIITVDWLLNVTREDLLDAGVEPFAADRIAIFQQGNRSADDSATTRKNLTKGAILAAVPIVCATQTVAVGTAGLAFAGFTEAGVAAGSLAATVQGPATAAGSWFALCQSAGATGAITGPVGIIAGIAAAGIGLGVGIAVVSAINKYGKKGLDKLSTVHHGKSVDLTVAFKGSTKKMQHNC